MQLNKKILLLFLLTCYSFSSCQKRGEQIKLSQYMVEGTTVYQNHCANCHTDDGTGLANVIPPLKNSDYLMTLSDHDLACQIKTGLSDSIYVNGILFYQQMPASESLTYLEIAEVVTYVNNTWGRKDGLYGVRQAEKDLSECN